MTGKAAPIVHTKMNSHLQDVTIGIIIRTSSIYVTTSHDAIARSKQLVLEQIAKDRRRAHALPTVYH